MGVTTTITKPFKKFVPSSKGIVANAITGVGFDKVAKSIDAVVGSPVQRTFSFNVPFLGSVGIIDLINYLVHSQGKIISKKGFIAVGAARFVDGTLPAIGGFNLGGSLAPNNPVAAGVGGA